jgi:hypothetical protein
MQASVLTPTLLNAVPEQLNTKGPFIVRNVHQPSHQFERLELSDVFDQQIDCALCLIPEKDVRVFVHDFSDFVVLDVFEVVQGFFVVFF